MRFLLHAAVRTHTGKIRDNNEDNFYLQGTIREDVARQDETAAALLDWDIKKLWRGPEFYYLFGSSEGYTLLPLRAFQDEEARLRFESLAQEANPDMIFRHFG